MLNRRHLGFALAGGAAALAGGLVWQLNALPLAPAVNYTLLDGRSADSAQWRGRVMLVNFWATSCATCVKKMPMLMATHRKYESKGFEVLAVAMQYDPPAFVAAFAQERQLPFGVAIDHTGAISQAFGDVRVTPTTVIVDRQGQMVKRLVGDIDEAELHGLIEKLL
ncbi:TlpA disulfide reductase family protein [Inhella sp.]|uniref:TlpA disulfide reductase family protein n=1 Tax=Inhella sp. TaxID=1921806 RepID=UPI0035AF0F5C